MRRALSQLTIAGRLWVAIAVTETLRGLRFEGGNQLFVYDRDVVLLMHPTLELQGKSQAHLTDPTGKQRTRTGCGRATRSTPQDRRRHVACGELATHPLGKRSGPPRLRRPNPPTSSGWSSTLLARSTFMRSSRS